MGYTVGTKRKFWFGFNKYSVTRHSWDGRRLLLDLADGGQISLPGVPSLVYQVYPDFWNYLQILENQSLAEKARAEEVERKANAIALQRKLESEAAIPAQPQILRQQAPGPVTIATRQLQGAAFYEPPQDDIDTLGGSRVSEEARRNAEQRVRGILQSEEIGPS